MKRLLALTLMALCATAAVASPVFLQVSYVSADRVYVDGGNRQGLAPGDHLSVLRDDATVATLEVVYAAAYSASCRVVEGAIGPQPGDRVAWEVPREPQVRLAALQTAAPNRMQEPTPTPPVPPAPRYTREAPARTELRSSVSGSLTFDWEQFTDDSGFGRDFDRSSARISLRGRNLGGMPLQLRLRSSTRSLDRVIDSEGSSSIRETRDRLYEVALAWEPPEGRFALRLGRLRLGRYAGAGTIDGISTEMRLGRVFRVGLFGGARSNISDFGIDGDRTSYGLTTRWTSEKPGSIRELLIAGAREEGVQDVSREYVAVQARLSGGRWSFYQRAEIDLNNGWRAELSDSSSQLSSLFVNATATVSANNRFTLSYSQFERYRTEETRFIPEALFDDSLRQGLRARWTFGRPGGLTFNLSAGLRERDGDDENATSAGLGVNHNNLFGKRLSVGLNLLSFSNEFTDGNTAILRVGKRLRGGHRVNLTAGARLYDDALGDNEERETQWLRLDGWFELPGNLFGRAEVEASSGDEIEGQRYLLGLGYRL